MLKGSWTGQRIQWAGTAEAAVMTSGTSETCVSCMLETWRAVSKARRAASRSCGKRRHVGIPSGWLLMQGAVDDLVGNGRKMDA